MTDHEIKKPTLFISHATSDAPFAVAVQHEIEKTFANGITVFCTSSPGMITGGADWLTDVEKTLELAQAVVAIVTPVSIERPWLWFEIGATWLKGRSGECRIYPLCAPEIELSALPSPLDRLQALSMGRAQDLKLLFEALISQFGFGNISSFRASNITKRIPKYRDVEIAESDRNERVFYSGKYHGYSDEELMEVIDSLYVRPDNMIFESLRYSSGDRESLIHRGKLIHYRSLDSELELPPGTSKRLLGLVDISFEPDQCRSKMQESHETSCEFFIASENASIPLDFVDETFDDVAFSVADSVIVPWLLAIAAGRDDHLYLLSCEQLSQGVRIVAFIGNNGVKMERGEQRFSLGHIMAFTTSQDER